MSKRIDVTVLGTIIGTASGWDEVDIDCLMYYDFVPNLDCSHAVLEKFPDKSDSISINYTTGVIEAYDNDKVIFTGNLTLHLA